MNYVTTRPVRTAAEDLQHILDHWEHLRDALDTDGPGTAWPPSQPGAAYLRALDVQDAAEVSAEQSLAAAVAHALHHPQQLVTVRHASGQLYYQCAHCEHVGEGLAHPVRADRDPAQLGERPVPIRLHVADACRAIEIGLCSLADSIAERDASDPVDWHRGDRALRTAPVAAGWLLGRVGAGPCCPTHYAEQERIAEFAREAARRLDRVLGIGYSSAVLPMPCPWCAGDLVMHMEAGTVTAVTCATGLIDCAAPVPFDIDRRARVWSSVEQLAALQRALDAAERARAEEERRARRTEDRRRQRAAARDRAAAA
ncbi:hypothetical protein OHT52_21220 [Streptomyces sp. NBC_00247]|uniref:hypothetical protein n=1 Tax=Streptomyces sp. NBC_00247 TaxID=2975689 RepID=UPI002E2B5CE0|nr:hypothetical protein [Streptomyces sp. NBC_00247]